jgi:hypothetical protein
MRRLLLCAVALFPSLLPATPAVAGAPDAWHQFWANTKRDFWRNNAWPQPFVETDRAAAVAPFAVMIDNGWRMQNLMGDYHFNPDSQELTNAGKEKIRWILTQVPPPRRTIFVQRGLDREKTAIRVDAVQKIAAQILPQGDLPAVEETNLEPKGWPAEEINNTYTKHLSTAPPPRLPEAKADDK